MNTDSDLPLPSPHKTGLWSYNGTTLDELSPELTDKFLGKILLLGVTYEDHLGNAIETSQFWGNITELSPSKGIVVTNPNSNSTYSLPPDLDSISEAPPGEYRLKSTGEVVVDPDFLTTWTRTAPSPEDAEQGS